MSARRRRTTELPPDDPPDGDVAATVDALASAQAAAEQRRSLVTQLASQAGSALPRARPRAVVQWVTDTVTRVAPQLPVRDAETLRRHHPGLVGDPLADRLVRNAARATAGIGAACGGLAAVKWAVPPTLLAAPVLLGAETVAVVAVEVKLVAELHHVYGRPVPGDGPEWAMALLKAWADQRGIDPLMPGVGVGAVLGTAARHELRDRLARRFSRNLTTLGPLLTGAAVASYLNQRATRVVAQRVRADLRG